MLVDDFVVIMAEEVMQSSLDAQNCGYIAFKIDKVTNSPQKRFNSITPSNAMQLQRLDNL